MNPNTLLPAETTAGSEVQWRQREANTERQATWKKYKYKEADHLELQIQMGRETSYLGIQQQI